MQTSSCNLKIVVNWFLPFYRFFFIRDNACSAWYYVYLAVNLHQSVSFDNRAQICVVKFIIRWADKIIIDVNALIPKYYRVQIEWIFYNASCGSSSPKNVLFGREEVRRFDTWQVTKITANQSKKMMLIVWAMQMSRNIVHKDRITVS